jgi:hypothetical protein
MDFDAGAVDKEPIRHILGSRQGTEDVLPDAALGPAHETVVKRLLGTVDIGAVSPATAAFQRMDDPAENTAIVNSLLAANIGRQQRLNPRPLRIRKPKEIRHFNASSLETSNHNSPKLGIPLWVRTLITGR